MSWLNWQGTNFSVFLHSSQTIALSCLEYKNFFYRTLIGEHFWLIQFFGQSNGFWDKRVGPIEKHKLFGFLNLATEIHSKRLLI